MKQNTHTSSNQTYVMRLNEVCKTVGLSKVTIYESIKNGTFPAQVKLSTRASGWLSHEVFAWLEERANERKEAC